MEEAERHGCDPAILHWKERIVRNLVKAARAVTLMHTDKVPIEGIHKLLGVSQTYRKKLMKAEAAKIKAGFITRDELLRVLKNRLEKLRPSRKQRRKREAAEDEQVQTMTTEQQAEQKQAEVIAANPKWPCAADCRCVRHAA
ncbi:MAG TPA: hypothetical protein VL349_08170 [Terriglobales bacterium]|jgi:hypothetical protein|nr:hypothetical protein [Terriglobales bacterium]